MDILMMKMKKNIRMKIDPLGISCQTQRNQKKRAVKLIAPLEPHWSLFPLFNNVQAQSKPHFHLTSDLLNHPILPQHSITQYLMKQSSETQRLLGMTIPDPYPIQMELSLKL